MKLKNWAAFGFAWMVYGAFAAFDESTIAFYPFNDGEGAISEAKVLQNAVDPETFAGKVTPAGTSTVTFDDDAPGMYVFDDISGALPKPIFTSPKSIYMTGAQSTDCAYLTFADIATALSKMGAGTVEFFYKQPSTDPYCTWSRFYACDAGITEIASGKAVSFASTPSLAMSEAYKDEVSAFTTKDDGSFGTRFVVSTGLARDAWHHYAVTYSENTFKVTIDYVSSVTLKGYKLTDLGNESVPLRLGRLSPYSVYDASGFHGKFSCVRVSNKVLSSDRFLRCSANSRYYNTREGENIDMPGSIAFYTFKEGVGKIGESVGTTPIYNDIAMEDHIGTPSIKTGGSLVYDDDAPGKYVFAGYTYDKEACTTNPLSLRFSSSDSLSANVVFSAVGTALSRNLKTTVEFFWKLDDAKQAHYQECFTCNDGCGSSKIYLPFTNKSGSGAKEVRVYDGGDVSTLTKEYANFPEDGLWHHLALVFDNGTYRLYNDYQLTASKGGYEKSPLSSTESFNLGRGYYKGKLSCFRVSTNALQVAEMLHVSSLPTCRPAEVFRWRLEGGAAGANMTTVSNGVPSFAALNPNQYHALADRTSPGHGTGVLTSHALHYPVYAMKKCHLVVVDPPELRVDNFGSAYLEANKVAGNAGFAAGGALHSTGAQCQSGSVTMEGFFRFSAAKYKSHVDDGTEDIPHRIGLMNHMRSAGKAAWKLWVDKVTTKPTLVLTASCVGGLSAQSTWDFPGFASGWHQYAVVYDEDNLTVTTYCDKSPVMATALPAKLDFSDSLYYSIGESGNEQPFEGWVDEVRLTRGVLDASRFVVCEGDPGVLILVR